MEVSCFCLGDDPLVGSDQLQRFPSFLAAFCPNCESHPQRSAQILHDEAAESARAYHRLMEVCKACSGHRTPDTGGDQISCDSLDCPIMYARVSAENKLRQGESLLRSANLLPKSLAW